MQGKIIRRLKVFIVDDHEIVRHGLIQYINSSEDFTVCGDAADASSAVSMINDLDPDIAVVDLSLEGTGGLDLIKAIRQRYKNIRILVHSMHTEIEVIRKALKAGAMGYVPKSEPVDRLLDALNEIKENRKYLSGNLKNQLFDEILLEKTDREEALEKLSERELEIFKMIGRGLNRSDISRLLNLNSSTIGTYRDRIKEKLGINSSGELVKFAVEWTLKKEE
jgi:DNA-binding NarL/FixJ family response regulator